MNCHTAAYLLALRHPGIDDLGPEGTADLDRHLAGCPGCAAESRARLAADAALARAMKAVPVPPGLKAKLHRDLAARRAVASRRRFSLRLAAAASVLLAVGLGFGVAAVRRPPLDLDAWVSAAEQDPDAATRAWLAENDLPDALPEPFDLNLLVSRGTERVQGRDVPVMVFCDGRGPQLGTAKVYYCRDDQFVTAGAAADAQASYFKAVTYRDDRRRLSIVVVHTGTDLKPFLRKPNRTIAA